MTPTRYPASARGRLEIQVDAYLDASVFWSLSAPQETSRRGNAPGRGADRMHLLMRALGYDRRGVQGSDWSTVIGGASHASTPRVPHNLSRCLSPALRKRCRPLLSFAPRGRRKRNELGGLGSHRPSASRHRASDQCRDHPDARAQCRRNLCSKEIVPVVQPPPTGRVRSTEPGHSDDGDNSRRTSILDKILPRLDRLHVDEHIFGAEMLSPTVS